MIRKIIQIDEEKCNGCGLCAEACHEGAIGMVDGKARLLRDDYCDGLGDCLPACPAGAITFTEREAAAYDQEAVRRNQEHSRTTQLNQWPVQIKLAPLRAPYYEEAGLLIAADCAAYAYGRFHQDFMRGKVTLIGCPKLYKERDGGAHGGALLRRDRTRGEEGSAGQRPDDPLAGGHDLHGRTDSRLRL